jgi:paraquat-inducible protein B
MSDTLADALADNALDPLSMRRRSFSLVWLVPIVAVLIGLWVGWLSWSERGFYVDILFKNVSGLEEGKSKVRYRNLDVGTVAKLEFAEDSHFVKARIEMKKGTERFLSKDTRFWIVRARLGVDRISGLETILSGSYITMDLPTGQADDQRTFTGLENPPAALVDDPGSRYRLYAGKRGSVSIGSPVFYRNITVGIVTDVQFDFTRQWVSFEVFVREPYNNLISMNTVFWNASGFNASIGANGVELAMESLEALISGGVAFDLPTGVDMGKRAGTDFLFHLYPNEADANKQRQKDSTRYVLYFDDSIRGLATGAPVEYSGLRIGEVIHIGAEYDIQTLDIHVPVTIEIERKMFRPRGGDTRTDDEAILKILIKKGLRASLGSASLLTGSKFIDISFMPNAPEPTPLAGVKPAFPVIPTVSGGLASIQNSISSLVSKLDHLPIESLGKNLNETLKNSSGAMLNLEKILKPQSQIQVQLLKTLEEAGEASKAIRDLSRTLERNPQSLIFGKPSKTRTTGPSPDAAWPR